MSVLAGTFDFQYEQVRIFLQCFNFFALLFHVLKLEMAKRQGWGLMLPSFCCWHARKYVSQHLAVTLNIIATILPTNWAILWGALTVMVKLTLAFRLSCSWCWSCATSRRKASSLKQLSCRCSAILALRFAWCSINAETSSNSRFLTQTFARNYFATVLLDYYITYKYPTLNVR